MPLALGFDTSNYTTSAAQYDLSTGRLRNCGRLLSVLEGHKGLRQSDALFQHIKNLPLVIDELGEDKTFAAVPAAVGVSTRPRSVEGSYMPCFLAGIAAAKAAAASACAPLYEFSHQEGHIAAAAYGAGRLELMQNEFLAWHLSGGTSELVRVMPNAEKILTVELIGETSDLSAGQVIDRAGVAIGLSFPCGKELDKLSMECESPMLPAKLYVDGTVMSLSGLENKTLELIRSGEKPKTVARFVLESVYESVRRVTFSAIKKYPGIPLLCAGGVMCNTIIREHMISDFGALFSKPEFSSDNAAGTALLAALKAQREGIF
jgi:N6-L-threonylcarbamoyladenine synthase